MLRILLIASCVLLGLDFLEDQIGNMDWLPMAQRVVISLTAILTIYQEFKIFKSFRLSILVFMFVLFLYNPIKPIFEVSVVTKVALMILFFVQMLKAQQKFKF